MAKTQEELNAIKEEAENVSKKLNELTDEELAQVYGGQDLRWVTLFINAAPNLGLIGTKVDERLDLE